MKFYKILVLSLPLFVMACQSTSGMRKVEINELKTQEYVYNNLSKDKEAIFKKARDYFAISFGDSNSVVRVSDIDEGKYIGKGVIGWTLSSGMVSVPCASNYTLQFLAKDNKAKLSLTINPGNVLGHNCRWKMPTVDGYKQILTEFDKISLNLSEYLTSKPNDDF